MSYRNPYLETSSFTLAT